MFHHFGLKKQFEICDYLLSMIGGWRKMMEVKNEDGNNVLLEAMIRREKEWIDWIESKMFWGDVADYCIQTNKV